MRWRPPVFERTPRKTQRKSVSVVGAGPAAKVVTDESLETAILGRVPKRFRDMNAAAISAAKALVESEVAVA